MSEKGVSYGSVSDIEADTFDSNTVSSVGRLKKTAQSLIGTHRLRKPKPTARTRFDGWLRRDYSVKGGLSPGLMTSSQIRNLTGTSRGDKIMDAFLGPTDRTIQNLIRSSGGLGLEYQSLDRSVIDTAVWHRRKANLIQERRRGMNEDEDEGEGGEKGKEEEYEFDTEAVAELETEREWFQWGLIVAIGVTMAIVGVFVSTTADVILDMKLEASMNWFERAEETSYYWYYGLAQHVATSAFLAILAFIPVAMKPVSAGSGIAEAKACLNGVVIPDCTAIQTCLCKAISVICSVAASLPAGLEGPMIFMGLSIGDNANQLVPRNKPALDLLRTDRHKIDFAAIGCASGVAAAFRSPIAGVLFAMEEGSSFWSTNLTWRCFLSACVTVITMYAIMTKVLGSGEGFHVNSMAVFNGIDSSSSSNFALDDSAHPDFALWEYVMFVLVGSAGGIIGGAFCIFNRSLALLRRYLAFGTFKKGLEVLTIATVSATLIWVLPSLPILSRCTDLEGRRLGPAYFRQFNCEEGEYNELATLVLNPLGAKGITLLFTEDDNDAFSILTCVVAGCLYLVVLCISFGMAVSAGIFIPLLFIGACLGRAIALVCNLFLASDWALDPRTYAIIGAAATLGGVVRVLISLTAIVTHTTSLSFFMTPVMLSTLLAQTVGNWLTERPGIYDIILQLRGIPFLEEQCPVGASHANIRARNIMSPSFASVGTSIQLKDLVHTLRTHNGCSDFPVVDSGVGGGGNLVGSISRRQLLAVLSQKKLFYREGGEGELLSYSEIDSVLPSLDKMPTGDDIGADISPEDEQKFVYVAPYMQIAPVSIHGHGSAERAYEMFRSLGLRTVYVVDKQSRPIGIIKRHELARLEELGHLEHEIE